MTITSSQFLLFVIGSLAVYYLLPRRPQNLWLLLISFGFIVSWHWAFAVVLVVNCAINYGLARLLARKPATKRLWLWAGIAFNLLLLLFFRSTYFFLPELMNSLATLGIHIQSEGLRVLIPLGLSYYVLSAISYLVDVYRGQMQADTNFLNFVLYLAYFPKLIAGPIERAQSFLPKLAQPRVVDNELFAESLTLIFVGLMRKLFIADVLTGSLIPDVFELPAKYTPTELMIWLVIYAFALYNDFAGYTNIVRGVSGLFGIELHVNFQTPYFSRSFTEFWTRWHISLSEWLRDYVYFPLSRMLMRRNPNRQSAINLVIPPMITMMVSGLWHGLGFHMLLWGALHGFYQVVERILTLRRSGRPQEQPVPAQIPSMLVVFIFVILAWVPFRWELPAAFQFYGALLNWESFDVRYRRMFLLFPIILLSVFIDFLQYYNKDEFIFLKWNPWLKSAGMALVIVLVIILSSGDFEQPFVYQAF